MTRRQSGEVCVRLPRYDLGQRPLNSIHFFTNHPDRLLIARTWHGCDCFYRLTNLAVAIHVDKALR